MSKEGQFFIYLLERYAAYKGTSATKILQQWEENEITTLVFDMYEIYHQERLENAFEDLDRLASARPMEPGKN